MTVLTEEQSQHFLARHNLGSRLSHLDPARSRSDVETDIGRRYAYANLLTNHLVTDQDSLVCIDITDWAVWPSSQNMDLFYSYRKFLGETRSLKEAHFHAFCAQDAKELRNIIHLGLISLFDVAGASTTTEFRFYASHDEYIEVLLYDDAPWVETVSNFFR